MKTTNVDYFNQTQIKDTARNFKNDAKRLQLDKGTSIDINSNNGNVLSFGAIKTGDNEYTIGFIDNEKSKPGETHFKSLEQIKKESDIDLQPIFQLLYPEMTGKDMNNIYALEGFTDTMVETLAFAALNAPSMNPNNANQPFGMNLRSMMALGPCTIAMMDLKALTSEKVKRGQTALNNTAASTSVLKV